MTRCNLSLLATTLTYPGWNTRKSACIEVMTFFLKLNGYRGAQLDEYHFWGQKHPNNAASCSWNQWGQEWNDETTLRCDLSIPSHGFARGCTESFSHRAIKRFHVVRTATVDASRWSLIQKPRGAMSVPRTASYPTQMTFLLFCEVRAKQVFRNKYQILPLSYHFYSE